MTKDSFLVYDSEKEFIVRSYTDATFQINKNNSKLLLGFVLYLNDSALTWKNSKQEIIVGSSTKAEYILASSAAKEVVWIRKFIHELRVIPSIRALL